MKKTFRLEGLGCANCAAKMEQKISRLDGVTNASINFMTTKMVIEAQEEHMETIVEAAEKIIKKIESDVIVRKA